MWNFEQPYFEGKLIGAHEAWNRLDSWRAAGLEIGAWYVAKSGAVRALGRLAKARGGRIDLDGESVHARFDLRSARFAYHPTGIHPRWPMGPTVEVMALHAFLASGEWLMLAEGLKPEGLPGWRQIAGGSG